LNVAGTGIRDFFRRDSIMNNTVNYSGFVDLFLSRPLHRDAGRPQPGAQIARDRTVARSPRHGAAESGAEKARRGGE
jgi:hypothetical protein